MDIAFFRICFTLYRMTKGEEKILELTAGKLDMLLAKFDMILAKLDRIEERLEDIHDHLMHLMDDSEGVEDGVESEHSTHKHRSERVFDA